MLVDSMNKRPATVMKQLRRAWIQPDVVGTLPLPQQVAHRVDHLAGALGVMAQDMPPLLEPRLSGSRGRGPKAESAAALKC